MSRLTTWRFKHEHEQTRICFLFAHDFHLLTHHHHYPPTQPVKVNCEASIVFPLIVSQTFAKGGPKVPIKTNTAQPASEASTQHKGATEKSGL